MVSVDNYLNETTRHADVILPGLSALEQPHYDEMICGLGGAQRRQVLGRRSSRPTGEPAEWEILLALAGNPPGRPRATIDVARSTTCYFAGCSASMAASPHSRIAGRDAGADLRARSPTARARAAPRLLLRHRPVRRRLSAPTPTGSSLDRLRRHPHGIDLGAARAAAARAAAHAVGQDRARARAASSPTWRACARARPSRDERPRAGRPPRTCARTTRGCTTSRARERPRALHVARAPRRRHAPRPRRREPGPRALGGGIIEVPVEVSDEMMPGVVSLPHGWGHRAKGPGCASRRATPASTATC